MHLIQLVSPSLSYSIVFQFSSKVLVLISLFAFLQFYLVISWDGKVHYLLTVFRSGHLAKTGWSVSFSVCQWNLNDIKSPYGTKNSSLYSSQSLKCCCRFLFWFPILLVFLPSAFLYIPSIFQLPGKIHVFVYRFAFVIFPRWFADTRKSTIYIIIISLFLEFFMPALADGFSQEFDWQQVSSNLQNSPQYSSRS